MNKSAANQTKAKTGFKFHSIQTKLTLSIILILIPVIALLSFVSFRNAQTLLKNRISEGLETAITSRQDRINQIILTSLEHARLISSSDQGQDLLLVKDATQSSEKLETLLFLYPEFEEALVFNDQGRIRASTFKDPAFEVESLIKAAGSHQKPQVFESRGHYYVSVNFPEISQASASALLRINQDKLAAVLRDYGGLGLSGEVILGKRQGDQVVYLNSLRHRPNAQEQLKLTVSQNPRLPLVLAVQKLSGTTIAQDYRGEEVIASYRHLPATDWGLVVKMDAQEAYAPIQRLRTELIQVSLLILILFLLVAFAVSRSITEPLHRLQLGTEKIGKGEWDLDLDIHTGDEVEQLANEFTKMAKELQQLYQGLEQKVKERTVELRSAKEDIEKEKKKAETILASIGDGVIVTGREGKIIFFNRAAEDFSGYSQDEVLGKNFYEILKVCREKNKPLGRDSTLTHKALNQAKAERNDDRFFTHKDGRLYPVSQVATPLIIEGEVIGAIVAFRDITREKEIDRMKTEFISVASHQLRTPLSAIKWFTEMLITGDAGKINSEQKKFLQQIYGSNERMIELVNSLLNVSRIEQGRISIDPQPTDLGELVDQVLVELKPKVEKKKLRVAVSKNEKLPKVNIDPKLIRQVYANLLSNAVKYTEEGGEINVFISRKDDEIISQIEDSGYGIPKEQQKQIFSKFFRADNILKVSAEGSGLGLYIVKSVVESSGGRIWFESEEGKGATFWFTLPVEGTPPRKGQQTLEDPKL